MKKTANQVLAENLGRLMGTKWNFKTLGGRAGLAANTIKNYRNPDRDGSANLADLEKLAAGLGVSIVELITEHAGDGAGQSVQAEETGATLGMNMVSTALDMLVSVLESVDADGRSIVAPALRSFALDPHGNRSRLMKAFAAALDAPTPTEPPPGTTADDTGEVQRKSARPSLVAREGGGQTRQQMELLPKAVRKIIDNTSPESLRQLVDNRNAPDNERNRFYAKLKPKASVATNDHSEQTHEFMANRPRGRHLRSSGR